MTVSDCGLLQHYYDIRGYDRRGIPTRATLERLGLTAEAAVAENIQRRDLNPIEMALAMQRYMDGFGKTSEECGQFFGCSAATVRGKVRLLELPDEAQTRLAGGTISEGTARTLLSMARVADEAQIIETIKQIEENDDDQLPEVIVDQAVRFLDNVEDMWDDQNEGKPRSEWHDGGWLLDQYGLDSLPEGACLVLTGDTLKKREEKQKEANASVREEEKSNRDRKGMLIDCREKLQWEAARSVGTLFEGLNDEVMRLLYENSDARYKGLEGDEEPEEKDGEAWSKYRRRCLGYLLLEESVTWQGGKEGTTCAQMLSALTEVAKKLGAKLPKSVTKLAGELEAELAGVAVETERKP